LSDLQSGFRKGHGCTTATLKVPDDVITAMDNKPICVAAFTDRAKAAGNFRIHLYADDTMIFPAGPSLHSAVYTLQQTLISIQQSFDNHHLLLNSKKTKCILFDQKPLIIPSPPKIYSADSSKLNFVSSNKNLGFWLDSTLLFNTHINNLLAKVKARLGFLYRKKASFTHSAKFTLVKMTNLPLFEYGDIIYKMVSKTTLRKLDTLHHSPL